MGERRYDKLPESVCRLLRAAHGGLATVDNDIANFCLRIDGQRIEYAAARDYIEAWRKSGLWRLLGTDDSNIGRTA